MQNDKTMVSVLTARGMAAIGSVAVAGDGAKEILRKVFRSYNPASKTCGLETGGTVHGVIVDGQRVIDEVLVGCEGANRFVIHCHGNPLLLEQVIKLLQSHGAKLTDAEHLAFSQHQAASENLIEAEAKLAMQKSATLEGVRILQAQVDGGLSAWAQKTVESFEKMAPEAIRRECIEVLEHSKVAKRIIEGVRIVIAGPPNSGKSMLLNCLAGRQQAVVSDTAGTTRDWVSVMCQLGPIRAELVDTAGLDEALAGKDTIEQTAQQITKELLESSDLVLYVQDVIEARSQKSEVRINLACPVIYIGNKCDLLKSQASSLKSIDISAKENQGMDLLAEAIMKILGVSRFDFAAPVVFTTRQRLLFDAILNDPAVAQGALERLR
jgi:tRNA modification GTPase